MSDGPKRIRSIDGGRSVRKDPRAEPATLPPAPPTDVVEAHSSKIPAAPALPRDLSANDSPIPSEVQSLAHFRHKMAALQSQLADVQRLLADEHKERAEEADQLARMLKHVSTADARARDAARELEEERDVSLELGKSLTHKEEECVALRGQVLDLEQKLEQVAALEHELGATKERLVDIQASEGELKRQLLDAISEIDGLKTVAAELPDAKRALAESRQDAGAKAQEIDRLGSQLKQAHMKAFAANKQLETWKVESQRTMEQLRKEHEEALTTLSRKLATSEGQRKALGIEADAVRRELRESRTRADSMRQHIEAAIKVLTLTSQALEAAEVADIEIQKLRATHEATRREILEQALGVRTALKRASEGAPTLEVSEADWSEDLDETK